MVSTQRGFTYLAVLLATALVTAGAAAIATMWHTQSIRDKEEELLFVGHEFRRAIGRYYESSPGVKTYPRRLEDLLLDPRREQVTRHLRRLYPDPFTNDRQWGLIRDGAGRIIGVHSLSQTVPLKRSGFAPEDAGFATATSHTDWQFIYTPSGSGDPASPARHDGAD
ncbi:MAG: type II secretion system protein [Burkholderiales bacterium]